MCQSGPALQSRAFLSEIKLKADEMRWGQVARLLLCPFGYKKGLVFFLLHKQLIKNKFLEKYRLILELKTLKFSVKFKYTICILNYKKGKVPWLRPIFEENRESKDPGEGNVVFKLTPHKAYWTYIQWEIHLILLCAQSEWWRGDTFVYLHTAPYSWWPHFFWNNSKQFEVQTGESSYCYSTKISMVSWLWKGHQVEKTV